MIRLFEKFLSFYKEIIENVFCFVLVRRIMYQHNNGNITKWIIRNSIK